ncbi:MAG TPA: retroviral-like aspartic protease family protein [Allosphingosinicella sp.]|jgi:predicted aspartyl protease
MAYLGWLAAALTLGVASAAPAVPETPGTTAAEQPQSETLGLDIIQNHRMTVPVTIGRGGPYRFIVDTGSERTVISREVAGQLGLGPGRPVRMHSMTEVSRVETAVVPTLQVGRRVVSNIHAPTIAEATLGADGLLGVDSLVSQRVDLDFRTNEMRVTPSRQREARWTGDTIVVTGRSRFGRLILVDASFDGERVWVIVDTGSQISIANEALRRRLARRGRLGPTSPVQVVSVTGGTLMVDYGVARRVRIGGIEILDLPVGFGDVEPFRKLELLQRPAILLGMDALQLFERVSLDFATREVRLQLPEG